MWPVLHQAVAVPGSPDPIWIPNEGAWCQGKLQGLQQTKDPGPKNSGRSSYDPRTGNRDLRVEEKVSKVGAPAELLWNRCQGSPSKALLCAVNFRTAQAMSKYASICAFTVLARKRVMSKASISPAGNAWLIIALAFLQSASRPRFQEAWDGRESEHPPVWSRWPVVSSGTWEGTVQLHTNMATAFSTNLKTEKPGPANGVCWFWASENSWFTSVGVCELSAMRLNKQQWGQASKPSTLNTASQPPRLGSISSLRGRKRETESSYAFLSGCLAHWHMSAVVTGWLGPKGDRWFKSELDLKMISPFQSFRYQKDECTGLCSFPHYFYLTAYRNHLPVLFVSLQPETDLLRIKIIFNLILDEFKSSLIISISLGYKD